MKKTFISETGFFHLTSLSTESFNCVHKRNSNQTKKLNKKTYFVKHIYNEKLNPVLIILST